MYAQNTQNKKTIGFVQLLVAVVKVCLWRILVAVAKICADFWLQLSRFVCAEFCLWLQDLCKFWLWFLQGLCRFWMKLSEFFADFSCSYEVYAELYMCSTQNRFNCCPYLEQRGSLIQVPGSLYFGVCSCKVEKLWFVIIVPFLQNLASSDAF
jgi:hypothetical protein